MSAIGRFRYLTRAVWRLSLVSFFTNMVSEMPLEGMAGYLMQLEKIGRGARPHAL